jgi:hypothetical protein
LSCIRIGRDGNGSGIQLLNLRFESADARSVFTLQGLELGAQGRDIIGPANRRQKSACQRHGRRNVLETRHRNFLL